MGRIVSRSLALFALVACAHRATAVPTQLTASLDIQVGSFPLISIVRGVTADVSLTVGGQVAMHFAPGAFVGILSLPVTDPAHFPIQGFHVMLANEEGTLFETPTGGLAGRLPLAGTVSACLFGACNIAVANVDVPFTEAGTRGVGIGGASIARGGFVAVTVAGAPWSTEGATLPSPRGPVGAPNGFAHGPLSSGAASAAATGGRIRVSTPIVVQTNIGAFPVLPTYALFDFFSGPIVDTDGDGILDVRDNCPEVPNIDQRDYDRSGVGDACNTAADPDGDEIENWKDNCDLVANVLQWDTDQSGIGDACNDAVDPDGDDWENDRDNCPGVSNPGQADLDGDEIGDACNDAIDFDDDEITDDRDNCFALFNPDQKDLDADLLGDLCDPFPNQVNDATRALRLELARATELLSQRTAERDAAEGENFALQQEIEAKDRTLGRPPCRADFNGDNVVNFADLSAFRAAFLLRCDP